MYTQGMEAIRLLRERKGISQRALAAAARLSFKGLQLMEQPGRDLRLSSLRKVAVALGLPGSGLRVIVEYFLGQPVDSVAVTSLRMLCDGPGSWKVHLFNFVDAFRASYDPELIASPPFEGTDRRLRSLTASTVEALCAECRGPVPGWCAAIGALPAPWFVAGRESLKASALVESPAAFRKRNIFVLNNFLARA